MKFTTAIAAFVGAQTILANPVTLTPREPRAAKRLALRKSHPRIPIAAESVTSTNNTDVSYSQNWAGAVLIGSGYKSVTGTITVPTPRKPSGGSSRTEYAASAWVGIDGDTCETSILQTGVDFYVEGTQVAFEAWYEWFPDYAYTFAGFAINAGDKVKMTATALSTTAGSVTIENLSTGKTVSHSFSGQGDALCETNAEWIVEDFESGGSLVPFADFDTVTFTGASVTETSGTTVGVTGAEILDIKQNGNVLTSCGISGSSTVTCTYE